MQVCEGIPSPIVITARHLAKRAPNCRYSTSRSRSPPSPSVIFSPGKFTRAFGGEQNFPICAAVLLRRRDVDALQSLLNCPRTLIGCQDSFAWCDEFFCYRFQIFSFHNSFLKIPNEIIVLFLAKCSEKCKSKAAGCSVRCPQRTSRQNNRLATCCAKQSACYSTPEQHRHEQEQEVD